MEKLDGQYDEAAAVTAHILNVILLDRDAPKHVLFSRIVYCVLEGMRRAQRELNERRLEPSEN